MALVGHLDQADTSCIRGWAYDDRFPDIPVSVVVRVGDTVLGRVLANAFRPDLANAGFAKGRCSFALRHPALLSQLAGQPVSVCFETDGAHLQGSPMVLEQAPTDDVEAPLPRAHGADDREAELADRIVALAAQTESG